MQTIRSDVGDLRVIQSCPVCKAELATVVVATDDGKVRVGSKCAGILEAFAKLMGVSTRRRPVLERLK